MHTITEREFNSELHSIVTTGGVHRARGTMTKALARELRQRSETLLRARVVDDDGRVVIADGRVL